MKRKYPEYGSSRRNRPPSNDGYFYDERPYPVSRQEQDRQRRRRVARRRRQRRRATWAAGCVVIAVVCIALLRFWPDSVTPSSLEDPASQGANGTGQLAGDDALEHVDLTPQSRDSETVLALKELAQEYAGKITIYKVNVDKQKELAALFNATSIPLFVFIPMKGDPQLFRGAADKATYKKAIDEFLLK